MRVSLCLMRDRQLRNQDLRATGIRPRAGLTIAGLAVLLGFAGNPAQAQTQASPGYVQVHRQCGNFSWLIGCKQNIVVPKGADAIISTNEVSGNDTLIRIENGAPAIIRAKRELVEAEAERLKAETRAREAASRLALPPPPKARILELRDDASGLLGGLFEIPDSSGILLASRHLFQKVVSPTSETQQFPSPVTETQLARAFNAANLTLQDYEIFGVERGTQVVDVVAFVPRSLLGQLSVDRNGARSLAAISTLAALPETGDVWSSWQLGSIEDAEVNQQFSFGALSRLSVNRIWLDFSAVNHTSPGSSGSLVWTATRPAHDESRADSRHDANFEWKLGGVTECIMPGGRDTSGIVTNGAVRVIPFALVTMSSLVPVTLEQLADETSRHDRTCIPIDRRTGGGWRTDGGEK